MTPKVLSDIVRDFVIDAEKEADIRGLTDKEKEKTLEIVSTLMGKTIATVTNVLENAGIDTSVEVEETDKTLETALTLSIYNSPLKRDTHQYIAALARHFDEKNTDDLMNVITKAYFGETTSPTEFKLLSEALETMTIAPLYMKEGVLNKESFIKALKAITEWISNNAEQGESKYDEEGNLKI